MLGIDIIEIERIERSLRGEGFKESVFTKSEIAYCDAAPLPMQSYAGLFAVKEAVLKALGTGIAGRNYLIWVEVAHDPSGKPYARLSGKLGEQYADARIEISISHCKTYAAAVAMIC